MKRRLNPQSRTELRSRTAVPNRIAVSIHRKLQAKTVAVIFCIGAVTPIELTLRQSHNRCANRNPKEKFMCFGGCCNRFYIPHWWRLINMLYHVRMFSCPKNYITQPVYRRVTLNRRFRRHESQFLILRIYTPNLRLITLSRLRLVAKVAMKINKGQFYNLTTLYNNIQLNKYFLTIYITCKRSVNKHFANVESSIRCQRDTRPKTYN